MLRFFCDRKVRDDIVVTTLSNRKNEVYIMKMNNLTVEEIIGGSKVAESTTSDFKVVDGAIEFTGYTGKKGYRAKLGDAFIVSTCRLLEVEPNVSIKKSFNGIFYKTHSIPVVGLNQSEIAQLIDLLNGAMKKSADDYKASKETK